jgi:hypothetical protein
MYRFGVDNTYSWNGGVKWNRVLTLREGHRLNVLENRVLSRDGLGEYCIMRQLCQV